MNLFAPEIDRGLELVRRVDPKYAPVWDNLLPEQQAAVAMYFLPHGSKKVVLCPTRPRIVKWYCPFADQREFPSGHRYCLNVYTGCGHRCTYCYAAGYEPDQPGCKKNFEKGLLRDLAELDEFGVPPAPLHLSNSTDAFQPLEAEVGQTRLALQHLVAYRHRFTTITLLTKNPLVAARPEYSELLQRLIKLSTNHPRARRFAEMNLPGLRVEVSLAFWREEVCAILDPGAPRVENRMKGIHALRKAGIPVVLRIDPLFPRNSVRDRTWSDFHVPEPQSLEDLKGLLDFAADVGVMHIVYSVAKILRPRKGALSVVMSSFLEGYRYLAGSNNLEFRGGSWRLPWNIAQEHVVEPFVDLCSRRGLATKFCKQNLITTP